MNVELTIQYLFDESPKLFQTRKEVLYHLLCSVGNGWEWKNGELIMTFKELKPGDITKAMTKLKDDKAIQHTPRVMNVLDRISKSEPLVEISNKEHWLLCNLPDDITDEWQNAIKECKKYLKEDKYD